MIAIGAENSAITLRVLPPEERVRPQREVDDEAEQDDSDARLAAARRTHRQRASRGWRVAVVPEAVVLSRPRLTCYETGYFWALELPS